MSHFLQNLHVIEPDWPAPLSVKALVTTRHGGVSTGPFGTLNLGDHVGDADSSVLTNRKRLSQLLPSEPCWLKQVHGINVVPADARFQGSEADASFTREIGHVSCVMTADCLPVLFCNIQGTQVAAAHAGWRGLLDGVLEETLSTFDETDQVMVWLGPAIGPDAFEVGPEVRSGFIKKDNNSQNAFKASPLNEGKYLADLYELARQRLKAQGVERVYGGQYCTYLDKTDDGDFRFFSYRREGVTGRLASCIWLASD